MNWKKLVEKKNANTFVLPSGWDSRDEVANQLECSPEKVDDHLRPALKSGEVIKQQFKVWDDGLKRLIFIVAYQETTKEQPAATAAFDFDKARKLKAEGKTWNEIGTALGCSGERVRSRLRPAR